jgi:fructose-1,6-bisphosphatase
VIKAIVLTSKVLQASAKSIINTIDANSEDLIEICVDLLAAKEVIKKEFLAYENVCNLLSEEIEMIFFEAKKEFKASNA